MEKGAVSGQIEGKLNHLQKEMAPRAGFEPATCRLTVECSTAELSGNRRNRRSQAGLRITKPFAVAKDQMTGSSPVSGKG